MADEIEDRPPAREPLPRRRVRAPTIDLKATEVAVEQAAGSESAPADAAATGPDQTAAAATSADPPPPRDGGIPSEPPPSHPRAILPWLQACLAGGGAALVVFLLLWAAGLFSGGGTGSAGLDARVASLESRQRESANRPPSAPDNRALDELAARVSKLETAKPPAGDAAAPEAIKNLQNATAEAARRAEDNATAIREARGRADAAMLAADAARVAAERADVETLNKRIAALEAASKNLSGEVAKSLAAAGDRPLRLAVAAQALRASVERGDPFVAELAAAKALAPDAQTLAPLEPYATTGLPSAGALARQLSDLAPALLRVSAAPAPAGGFLDRLQANAERLVRIRPIDEAPGDDPAAVINRAQGKASRGDFVGALAELNALPADARAPAADWIKRVEARNAAVAASRRLVSDALAGLAKSP